MLFYHGRRPPVGDNTTYLGTGISDDSVCFSFLLTVLWDLDMRPGSDDAIEVSHFISIEY